MSLNSAQAITKNYNAGGRQDRLLLGVLLMVFGESLFVLMGAIIKHTGNDLPLIQVIFFRNFAVDLRGVRSYIPPTQEVVVVING